MVTGLVTYSGVTQVLPTCVPLWPQSMHDGQSCQLWSWLCITDMTEQGCFIYYTYAYEFISHINRGHFMHHYAQIDKKKTMRYSGSRCCRPCSCLSCEKSRGGIPRDRETTHIPGLSHSRSPGHLSIIPVHHDPDEGPPG